MPKPATAVRAPLYQKLARSLEEQIGQGVLRPGDRVPSIRMLSRRRGVSISTVLEAYLWLENRGAIESRPKSGFYVRVPFARMAPEPHFQTKESKPAEVGVGSIIAEAVRAERNSGCVP